MSEQIRTLIQNIANWNKENIYELRDMLNELPIAIRNALADEEISEAEAEFYKSRVDITDLPSVDIPDDIDTGYPVWAMDNNGMCLTGDDMQMIDSVDEIRQFQAERRATTATIFHVSGYEMLEKVVKARGTSGGVYVPPDWIGKTIAVIRLD